MNIARSKKMWSGLWEGGEKKFVGRKILSVQLLEGDSWRLGVGAGCSRTCINYSDAICTICLLHRPYPAGIILLEIGSFFSLSGWYNFNSGLADIIFLNKKKFSLKKCPI